MQSNSDKKDDMFLSETQNSTTATAPSSATTGTASDHISTTSSTTQQQKRKHTQHNQSNNYSHTTQKHNNFSNQRRKNNQYYPQQPHPGQQYAPPSQSQQGHGPGSSPMTVFHPQVPMVAYPYPTPYDAYTMYQPQMIGQPLYHQNAPGVVMYQPAMMHPGAYVHSPNNHQMIHQQQQQLQHQHQYQHQQHHQPQQHHQQHHYQQQQRPRMSTMTGPDDFLPPEVVPTKHDRELSLKNAQVLLKPEMVTLVVGDGDFSFSRALMRLFGGKAHNLIASSYDSFDLVLEKYPGCDATCAELEQGGTLVLHDVDATKLHTLSSLIDATLSDPSKQNVFTQWKPSATERAPQPVFDRIVFNCPHTGLNYCGGGKAQCVDSIEANRTLLREFLSSARKHLRKPTSNASSDDAKNGHLHEQAQAHITLKSCIPYDSFKVVDQAEAAGLSLQSFVIFNPLLYPGYQHRQTQKNTSSRQIVSGTYVFVDRPDGTVQHDPQALADVKHSFRMSMLHCPVCDTLFNGPVTYQTHLESKKHARAISQRMQSDPTFVPPVLPRAPDALIKRSNADTHKMLPSELQCRDCGVSFTGPLPMEIHMNSKKHAKKMSELTGCPLPPEIIRKSRHFGDGSRYGASDTNNGGGSCEICRITCNSKAQLDAHYLGKTHRSRLFALRANGNM
jgi:rRNA (uridine-N3-)-methyltransferase BTM5-like/Zinc-finger of C2H2 type